MQCHDNIPYSLRHMLKNGQGASFHIFRLGLVSVKETILLEAQCVYLISFHRFGKYFQNIQVVSEFKSFSLTDNRLTDITNIVHTETFQCRVEQ